MLRRYERIKWDEPPAWAESQDTNPNIFNENSSREVVLTKKKTKAEPKQTTPQHTSSGWMNGGGMGGGGWL